MIDILRSSSAQDRAAVVAIAIRQIFAQALDPGECDEIADIERQVAGDREVHDA